MDRVFLVTKMIVGYPDVCARSPGKTGLILGKMNHESS